MEATTTSSFGASGASLRPKAEGRPPAVEWKAPTNELAPPWSPSLWHASCHELIDESDGCLENHMAGSRFPRNVVRPRIACVDHNKSRAAALLGMGATLLALWVCSESFVADAAQVQRRNRESVNIGHAVRFRVAVDEVLVPITVTTDNGRMVCDLALPDFRLFEDGVEQSTNTLLSHEAPLIIGLVIDLSGSMNEKIDGLRLALFQFLETLGPGDRAFVQGFSDDVQRLQSLTLDRRRLRDSLSQLNPSGNTALYDAVVEGLNELVLNDDGRPVLVVLSDGFDNSSKNTAHQAIRAAKVAGVPVYTVGLGEKSKRSLLSRVFPRPKRATPRGMDQDRLRELASSTGGRALFVADIQQAGRPLNPALRETFGRLSQELRCLYVLTYGPTEHGLDGRWHELYVEIRRPKLLARFRPGYLAAPPQ